MGAAACGSTSIVGHGHGVHVAFPMRCRSWDCNRCGPPMRRRLTTLAAGASPTTFLTLTASVLAHRTPEAAFRHLRTAWPRFIHRLRRYRPDADIQYLWVWETTRAGFPHLHVLLRAPFIPQRWLAATWQALAGSPVVDIRAVHDEQHAATYVAKYLTKRLQAPRGYRRWGASAGFLPEPFRMANTDKDPHMTWEWSEQGIAAIQAAWRAIYPLSVALGEDLALAFTDLGADRYGAASLRRIVDRHPLPRDGTAAASAFYLWASAR